MPIIKTEKTTDVSGRSGITTTDDKGISTFTSDAVSAAQSAAATQQKNLNNFLALNTPAKPVAPAPIVGTKDQAKVLPVQSPVQKTVDLTGTSDKLSQTTETNLPQDTSQAPSSLPNFQSIYDNLFGKDQTQTEIESSLPDYTAQKDSLNKEYYAELATLDTDYNLGVKKVEDKATDSLAGLQASLLKLGISPSDSSWSNAIVGADKRKQESLKEVKDQYENNKAKLLAGKSKDISAIDVKAQEEKFKAITDAADRQLKQLGVATDIFTLFSNRDEKEKDRELSAYKELEQNYRTEIGLDQKTMADTGKNFIENAQKGLYDISDPEIVKMLKEAQKTNPYAVGVLDVATSGLKDRLLDVSYKKAQTANIYSSIAKRSSSGSSDSTNNIKEIVKSYNEKLADVTGSDGFVSPQDYTRLRNEWIKNGNNPTDFDNEFKGFRNPNNENYAIVKKTADSLQDKLKALENLTF